MSDLTDLYIHLLKSSVMNNLYIELEAQLVYSVLCASHREIPELDKFQSMRSDQVMLDHLAELKASGDMLILQSLNRKGEPFPDDSLRNYAEFAHTLLGSSRLDYLEQCVKTILSEQIVGDFLQAGCWRGGSSIFIHGVQQALAYEPRNLWIADSFEGLPESRHAADRDFAMDKSVLPFLSVGRAEVKGLFERYGLLDDRVQFLEGWFDDTLKNPPMQSLSLLHIDADLYFSTLTVLESCYRLVREGGFVIIDDYGILPPCKEAVEEFLAKYSLTPDIEVIDEHAVAWRVQKNDIII